MDELAWDGSLAKKPAEGTLACSQSDGESPRDVSGNLRESWLGAPIAPNGSDGKRDAEAAAIIIAALSSLGLDGNRRAASPLGIRTVSSSSASSKMEGSAVVNEADLAVSMGIHALLVTADWGAIALAVVIVAESFFAWVCKYCAWLSHGGFFVKEEMLRFVSVGRCCCCWWWWLTGGGFFSCCCSCCSCCCCRDGWDDAAGCVGNALKFCELLWSLLSLPML